MSHKWLVIGISGVTCGGKTNLAKFLNVQFPHSRIISQDSYYLPESSPQHTFIAELNHINWELMSSLNMKKMEDDVNEIIGKDRISLVDITFGEQYATNNVEQLIQRLNADKVKLLIIEGFSIFNYKPIEQLCHLKYYFTLEKEECWKRRQSRVYDPPDVPGYFQNIVWPEYEKLRNEILQNCKNITYVDGKLSTQDHYQKILIDLGSIFIHNV